MQKLEWLLVSGRVICHLVSGFPCGLLRLTWYWTSHHNVGILLKHDNGDALNLTGKAGKIGAYLKMKRKLHVGIEDAVPTTSCVVLFVLCGKDWIGYINKSEQKHFILKL